MKSTFKSIGASALALALALCGYGAASPDHATFRPRVTHDVDLAIGVNLDKVQAFKVVDAYANLFFADLAPSFGIDDKDVKEAKERLAAFKEDPFRDAPESMRSFLERSGLRNAEYRWAVLSLADFKMMAGKPSLGGISLALAGTIDLDKLISACRQEDNCDGIFEKTQVEDETAWHIVPEKAKDVREMREMHIDPYVTSLDGRLVLAATSRETLARQIRLYRSGRGKGDALDGFSASDGELVHLHLSDIGGILRKYVPRGRLKELNQGIPDGDELALGLEDLDVSLNVTPNGMLRDSLRLVTASEKDADTLRTLAKMGILMLNAQMSKEPRAANLAKKFKKFFGEIQVGGTGRQLEIRCGFFPAVVAGALFPVISSAMLNANLSTMAMQGRKLVHGIILANVEREGKLGPVWPRTELAEGSAVAGDKDDVANRAYGSATEYFNALFDMKHYGQAEWEPFVDGELLPALWGCGVSAMSGRTLERRNVAWIVAANVTDETPDFVPVLITANFNPALLLSKWDGQTGGAERLPIGPKSGAAATPFGDKGIVVVRKSGAVETIKRKYVTYNMLYKRQAFDLTNMNPPIKYLTPSGVVEPVGHK